ncbi:MAG: amino acid ABC transporter permease [Verrucomicrobiales bacterium]
MARQPSLRLQALAWVVVLLVTGGLSALVFQRLAPRSDFSGVWEFRQLFVQGWLLTLGVSIAALACACLTAPLWAAMRLAPLSATRWFASATIGLLRGTPFLVLLLVGFYVIADALGLENRLVVGIGMLALYHGAYLGEMLRGGIESVGRTQWEAARAVGLDRHSAFRHVILPQALRRVLPGLAGQSITLVKDSALLSVIGVMELTKQAQSASTLTFSTFEAYLPMAGGYLLLTLPLDALAAHLERRFVHAD